LANLRELPAGTTIGQAYEAAGGQLSLLGEPGAGKSTLLVELGLELLGRARGDPHFPLPVLFNLGTWANDRLRLEDWLTAIPEQLAEEAPDETWYWPPVVHIARRQAEGQQFAAIIDHPV